MKKKIITLASVALILATTTIVLYSCKKTEINSNSNEKNYFTNTTAAMPTNIPSYLYWSDIREQMNRLCIGIVTTSARSSCCNKTTFQDKLENLVTLNKGKDIKMATFHGDLLTSNYPFNEPNINTYVFHDVLSYQIANNVPPTNIPAWNSDFYSFFSIGSGTGANSNYQVTVNVPSITYQLANNHDTKPILMMPDPEDYANPYPATAYYYDNNTNEVKEIIFANDEEQEDYFESGDYYFWVMRYESDTPDDIEVINNNCTETTQFDNFCDEGCGEGINNSPFDCGVGRNKTVYLRRIRFNEDLKQRGNVAGALKKHWETALGNNYEPAFSCWAVHANGRVTSIERRRLENISNEFVTRCRERVFKTTNACRGNSQWQDAILQGGNVGDEPIVAENYNPMYTILKFFMMEVDKNKTMPDNVPIEHNGNVIGHAKWRGDNVTSGKVNSIGFGLSSTNELDYYIQIMPGGQWVPDIINNEQVMVFRHNTGDRDDCDFEMYYFVNKSKK